MVCTLSSLYIPATASACSIPTGSRNGAFVPSGNGLKSKVSLSSFKERRLKAAVVRAESSKEGAIEVQNTSTKNVAEQRPRAVERATEISPFGKSAGICEVCSRICEDCFE